MASLNGYLSPPPKGDYVWVVKGDKVNSVPVKLGEQRNNQIEIVEGITEMTLSY